MSEHESLRDALLRRDRIADIPAAPRNIFERAYNLAMIPEPTRRFGILRFAAASVLILFVALAGFHMAGSGHAWSGWNLISAGEVVKADGSDRRINVYQGFSKTREIQLAAGGVVERGAGHWDLKSGEATFVVKPDSAETPFHVRAGGLDLLVENRAHYTVSGQASESSTVHAPVTVAVSQGTVHCCAPGQPFPILEGEKITLVKRDGNSVILAYETE
ncbi:MAG: hypothetical protein K8S54_04555 [Spirochaetia bacterium]|nr:hypothetical protein [Spirochaetia bacterium]